MSYYDGVWTTDRHESTWATAKYYSDANDREVTFLMVALDELAAK
jgi:hypothetical protein